MSESLRRLLQAVRFERDAFVWMDFNDRATGDALVFVVVTRILLTVGFGWSILGAATSITGFQVFLQSMINAAIFWLAYTGIVYATVRFLLEGSAAYATTLRIAGFAYPTLLLLLVTVRLFGNALLALLVGSLWFLAVVTQGVRYESGLSQGRAAVAAGAGLVGWVIVASIFGFGLI